MERIDADERLRIFLFMCVHSVHLRLEHFCMSALGARRPGNGLVQGCTSHFEARASFLVKLYLTKLTMAE